MDKNKKKPVQVITTVDSDVTAKKIANQLVKERIAACVQVIGPITSVYRWNNDMEGAFEWQCVIKTCNTLLPEVEKLIRSMHPYEVPEIIVFPLTIGSEDYFNWIIDETKD